MIGRKVLRYGRTSIIQFWVVDVFYCTHRQTGPGGRCFPGCSRIHADDRLLRYLRTWRKLHHLQTAWRKKRNCSKESQRILHLDFHWFRTSGTLIHPGNPHFRDHDAGYFYGRHSCFHHQPNAELHGHDDQPFPACLRYR